MWIEKNLNSKAHNWLIHHFCILSVKKNAPYLKGLLLDIGCGKKPYQDIIKKHCNVYLGFDHPVSLHGLSKVEVAGSALRLPFRSRSFDSVVSFQVMEHICEPSIFLAEAFRVLKPGGTMLLTTPFMWGEHEQPRDYYRYTRYGLRYLAEKAGFEVVSLEADTGSLATALLLINYLLKRLRLGPLRCLLYPVLFANQLFALLLHRVDRLHSVGTASFTIVLQKAERI